MLGYLAALQLEPGATLQQVRRAYRRLSLKWHPDKPGGDAAKFQTIKEAYEKLRTEAPVAQSNPKEQQQHKTDPKWRRKRELAEKLRAREEEGIRKRAQEKNAAEANLRSRFGATATAADAPYRYPSNYIPSSSSSSSEDADVDDDATINDLRTHLTSKTRVTVVKRAHVLSHMEDDESEEDAV